MADLCAVVKSSTVNRRKEIATKLFQWVENQRDPWRRGHLRFPTCTTMAPEDHEWIEINFSDSLGKDEEDALFRWFLANVPEQHSFSGGPKNYEIDFTSSAP